MSQQQMDFGESNRNRVTSAYTGYEGIPRYNDTSTYGQKLSGRDLGKTPPAGQRLALAIFSLLLLLMIIFVSIAVAAYLSSLPYDTPLARFFLIVGFFIFIAALIIINVLFNRRR